MYDYFRIVAPVDSTVISLDGTVVATIQAGSFYEFTSEQPVQVQTTNPVLLAQYAISATDTNGNFGGAEYVPWDPAMMIIPPTQQFMDNYTFANCIDTAFLFSYVNIVIPDAAVPTLMMDNQPIAQPFTSIPGSGYSYAQVRDSQGSHHVEANKPFGIYVYGYGRADSYANTGGSAFRVLNGLLVTTSDINFGGVSTDSCKDSVVVFGNRGNAPITVWSLWLADSNAGDFTVTGGKPPFTIAPGDSHSVHIKFCPSDHGLRGLATVRFSSNAVERPTITVHGVGTMVGVSANDQLLDYRRVLVSTAKDSLFTLTNVGVRDAAFDGLAFTGPDRAMWSVVAPVGKFTLKAGATQVVIARFVPTSVGIKHATIATSGTSGFYASVDLIGEGVMAAMGGPRDTIDYGLVKVGSKYDSLIVAKSVGFVAAAVDRYHIDGLNIADFVFPWFTPGTTLVPGDTAQVGVTFAPTSAGVKYALLDWNETGKKELQQIVVLKGNGAYAAVKIAPNYVDYGRVKVGKQRDSILQTTNIGPVPAVVTGYMLSGPNPGDFAYARASSELTLKPGEFHPELVSFIPRDTGVKHAILIVNNDGRAPDTIADLWGNARPGSYLVATKTDTIRARIGDTITVPVRLLDSLDDADITRYRILLGFDSTMLYPLAIHVDTSWSNMPFVPVMKYSAGIASVTASANGASTLRGRGVLYDIDMLVMMGDALETPLTFGGAKYIDNYGDSNAVTSIVQHGLVQITQFCGDSTGLIGVGAKVSLTSIAPNPLSGDALIAFHVPAIGPVHCSLIDMLGRDVIVFADGEHQPGQYVSVLHAGSVAPGAYTLVLQAGRFREMQRVEVVR